MENRKFTVRDGTELNYYLWDETFDVPKGVVQVMHGMVEHAARYERFAKYLNKQGYIVFADDMRGHGKNVAADDDVSKVGKDKDIFQSIVRDKVEISEHLKKEYGLPLFVFAHSYGSFVAQRYMQVYDGYEAVVLSGTAKFPGIMLGALLPLAWLAVAFRGADAPAPLIDKIVFGKNMEVKAAGLTNDKAEAALYMDDPRCGNVATAGWDYSMARALNRLHDKTALKSVDKDKPLFIIAGAEDGIGGNTKYVTPLIKVYEELGLTNLKSKFYSGARHEILNDHTFPEAMSDITAFYDSVLAGKVSDK